MNEGGGGQAGIRVVGGVQDGPEKDGKADNFKSFLGGKVMSAIGKLAVALCRSGRIDVVEIEVGEVISDGVDVILEMQNLLEERSVEYVSNDKLSDEFNLEDCKGEIFVWVEAGYETPWRIFVSDICSLPRRMSPVGGIYVFKAEGYLPKDEFMGMRYAEIVRDLGKTHGCESAEFKEIDRLIVLTRALIFTFVVPVEGKRSAFNEVRSICMRIGAPARAVVADFVDEYSDQYGESSYDSNDEIIGDDPSLCVGLSGCPFKSLLPKE